MKIKLRNYLFLEQLISVFSHQCNLQYCKYYNSEWIFVVFLFLNNMLIYYIIIII